MGGCSVQAHHHCVRSSVCNVLYSPSLYIFLFHPVHFSGFLQLCVVLKSMVIKPFSEIQVAT